MFKETVTYTDYNGNEREEDFFFNLTKAELSEMELTKDGGLSNYIQKIAKAQDTAALITFFKELLIKAYGEKSADGRRFIKTPEVVEAFTQTEAFSILFMKYAFDDEAAAKFINGITPKDISTANVEALPGTKN